MSNRKDKSAVSRRRRIRPDPLSGTSLGRKLHIELLEDRRVLDGAFPIEAVVLDFATATGVAGDVHFGAILNPSIGEGKHVAFSSLLGGDVDSSNSSSVWQGTPDGFQLVAREGSIGPGSNQPFTFFVSSVAPTAGGVDAVAFLNEFPDLFDPTLWVGQGAAVQLVAGPDHPPPGVAGDFSPRLGLPVVNANGQVVFYGTVVNGEESYTGLWLGAAGNPGLVAGPSQPVPGLGGNTTLGSPNRLDSAQVISPTGKTTFVADITGEAPGPFTEEAVFIGAPGALTLLVRSSTIAAGIGNEFRTFPGFETFGINGRDEVLFAASVTTTGDGVDGSNDEGLWVASAGSHTLAVREGDAAFGAAGANFSNQFQSAVLGGGGHVAVIPFLSGPGVDQSNRRGVWVGQPGALQKVARLGDPAPGTPAGVLFAEEISNLNLNSSGQVAFQAQLTGPGVTDDNDEGIWATDPSGELKLVAREGTPVNIGPNVVRTPNSVTLAGGDSGGQDGRRRGLNDEGHVLFRAEFIDDFLIHFDFAEGILLADTAGAPIPTPDIIVVNSTEDFEDTLPGDGICRTGHLNSAGVTACTLRAALQEADASATKTTVHFDIPVSEPGYDPAQDVFTIRPGALNGDELDAVVHPVAIDGYSQPGAAPATNTTPATMKIELSGELLSFEDGLILLGGNSDVRGLVINRFDVGIVLADGGNNLVEGNYIGTDPSGTLPLANDVGILIEESSDNTIGGISPASRNVISGNDFEGIELDTSHRNLIRGNFIGTDALGILALGNGSEGISLAASHNNTIGGADFGDGNVISANDGGVTIADDRDGNPSNQNVVQGNHIGTDVTGLVSLGNDAAGIEIEASHQNRIGGTEPGAGNVISANDSDGVIIRSNFDGIPATENFVQGNLIGTDATGMVALGNNFSGVVIRGSNRNTIGGLEPGAGNVISANRFEGVLIRDDFDDNPSTLNLLLGNRIGTDISGTAPLGNDGEGVVVRGSHANAIGGAVAGAGNIISANEGEGILIRDSFSDVPSSHNLVEGNLIGTDVSGVNPLGNAGIGILIEASTDNTIGGTASGAGNTIAHNQRAGVAIRQDAAAGNAVLTNSIFANGGLGIDLGTTGVTPNDLGDAMMPPDADMGPNRLQNFPTARVLPDGQSIEVSLTTDRNMAATEYRIELFANDESDPSGNGEGQTFLGAMTVMPDADGNFGPAIAPFAAPPDQVITATATNLTTMDTSEFSGVSVLIVNSTDDDPDLDLTDDRCDTDQTNSAGDDECTLRAAIMQANRNPDETTIKFEIPTGELGFNNGIWTILPTTPLPDITAGLIVDGYSQPTSQPATDTTSATPKVLLNGLAAGSNVDGLTILAGDSEVRGLIVSRFDGAGIVLRQKGGNTIAGNFLGTNAAGDAPLGNTFGLRIVDSPDNTIGGDSAADRNLISGNESDGLRIELGTSMNNRIIGNYIGIDAEGLDDLGNQGSGVVLDNAGHNTVGGDTEEQRNVVSGNDQAGIHITGGAATGNSISGNYIGTSSTGVSGVGNALAGVHISQLASGNMVGGIAMGEGNLIAFNESASVDHLTPGVWIEGGSENAVVSNSIFANEGRGIDLGELGVTRNVETAGPNNLQNFPVLTLSSTETLIRLDTGAPDTTYRLEFFQSDADDPSGYGEGQKLVSTFDVTTGSFGTVELSAPQLLVPDDKFVSATATRIDNSSGTPKLTDTSEFSDAVKRGSLPSVTVVTHGYVLQFSDGDTLKDLGEAIVERTDGNLVDYQLTQGGDGQFVTAVDRNSHNVVLFDWASESNETSPGWAEAAADALLALLVQQGLLDPRAGMGNGNLHFIAHSFGAALTSDVIERLAVYGVPVDHLTYLDPHDFDETAIPVDESQAEFDIGLPQLGDPRGLNYGATVWNNVRFAETYFQTRSIGGGPNFIFPEGRPILGSYNHFLDTELPLADGVSAPYSLTDSDHTWVWNVFYRGTVEGQGGRTDGASPEIFVPNYGALGYAFSRALGGQNERPNPQFPAGAIGIVDGPNEWTHPALNFSDPSVRFAPVWDPLVIVNGDFEAPGTVVTGTLDDIVPGWSHHGGGGDGNIGPDRDEDSPFNHFLELDFADSSRTHNYLYVPHHLGNLFLEWDMLRNDASSDDQLVVTMDDGKGSPFEIARIDLNAEDSDFVPLSFPVPSDRLGTVQRIKFEVVPTGGFGVVDSETFIDNVRWSATPTGVSGIKFVDNNGNGRQDAGEIGIGGFTIYADLNNNEFLDNGEPSIETSTDGTYSLDVPPGDHAIREVVPDGWISTTPDPRQTVVNGIVEHVDFGNFREGEIHGYKFDDLNKDGIDNDLTRLVGATFVLDIDANRDGSFETTSAPVLSQAPDGRFSFAALGPGRYRVREVLPPNVMQTTGNLPVIDLKSGEVWMEAPGAVSLSDMHQKEQVAPTLAVGDYTFGEIHGYKYDDRNGDGSFDGPPAEPRIAGVEIVLRYDSDDDGVFELQFTTTTDAAGQYHFSRLDPGFYQVAEASSIDFEQSSDLAPVLRIESGDVYEAFVNQAPATPGSFQRFRTVPLLAIGNFYFGEIHGYKYDDTNGNGVEDEGEPRFAGITIRLLIDEDKDGTFERSVTTTTEPVTGEYHFTGLRHGRYFAAEDLPIGTTPTSPTPPIIVVNSGDVWQAFAGQVDTTHLPRPKPRVLKELALGNFTLFDISGTKFLDRNGNGVRDPHDPILANWPIELDLDSDGIIDGLTFTNAAGQYTFSDVGPGDHWVFEQNFAGYEQTFPGIAAFGRHDVSAKSGVDVTGLDFGNRLVRSAITGRKYHDIDGDGQRDDDEPGLAGGVVYIDTNNDNVLNNEIPANNNICDDSSLEPCVETTAGGDYSFVVDVGAYVVRQVAMAGSQQTQPPSEQAHVAVINAVGESVGGLDFGTTHAIAGTVEFYSGAIGDRSVWAAGAVHQLEGTVTVPVGSTLTINPGAIVKGGEAAKLIVEGTLIATSAESLPIVFTSLLDDVGGDTNEDGAASSPHPGGWDHILFRSTSNGSLLENVEIRYGGASGAGMLWSQGADLSVSNSLLQNSFSGGLTADNGAQVTLQNSLIVNNSGAGIVAQHGADVVAINNTIDGNFSGVLADGADSTVELTNSLVTSGTTGVVASDGGVANLSFTNVFNPAGTNYLGMPDPTGTAGNLSADPLYVDATGGDYNLSRNSPAIDAGTGNGAPLTDHAGHPRVDDPAVPNTGSGAPNFIDMGALERGSAPPPQLSGDYNGDQVVDDADYDVWKSTYGQAGEGLAADGNNNGRVDAPDYTIWRNYLGATAAGASEATTETANFELVYELPAVAAEQDEPTSRGPLTGRRPLPLLTHLLLPPVTRAIESDQSEHEQSTDAALANLGSGLLLSLLRERNDRTNTKEHGPAENVAHQSFNGKPQATSVTASRSIIDADLTHDLGYH